MSRFKNGDITITRAAGLFRQSRLKPLLIYFFSSPKCKALFCDLPDSKRKYTYLSILI